MDLAAVVAPAWMTAMFLDQDRDHGDVDLLGIVDPGNWTTS